MLKHCTKHAIKVMSKSAHIGTNCQIFVTLTNCCEVLSRSVIHPASGKLCFNQHICIQVCKTFQLRVSINYKSGLEPHLQLNKHYFAATCMTGCSILLVQER